MRKPRLLAGLQQTDPLCKAPIVELTGERRVLIENHQGVHAYSAKEIKIKVRFGCVAVVGEKLYLRELSKEQLVISGRVDSIRLFRR